MSAKQYWNEERLAIVRKHAKTMTASQMCAAFFKGVSRSALISAAIRNGIDISKPNKGPKTHVRKRRSSADPGFVSNQGKKIQINKRSKVRTPPDYTHMRGSSAPTMERPAMQRALPPEPPEQPPRRQMLFECSAPGEWTLWNVGNDQCRYVIGHNGTLALLCGQIVMRDGCPYCRIHYVSTVSGDGRSGNVVPFRDYGP